MPVDEFLLTRRERDGPVIPSHLRTREEISGWVLAWTGSDISLAEDAVFAVLVIGVIDEVRGGSETAHATPAETFLSEWHRNSNSATDRCIGPWSVVVIDKSRGGVSIARDIAAGRAAFVSSGRGQLVAGSDLWTVASITGNAGRPDPLFVASYLQGAFLDPTVSPYKDVQVVSPGHVATQNTAGWQQRKVAAWRPPSLHVRTLDDAVDLAADHLDTAVRARVRNSDSPAVALSGGIDSTNVLASLRRVRGAGRLQALAIPFYRPDGDERAVQRAVADHLGADITWVDISNGGPVTGLGSTFLSGRQWPPQSGNWFLNQALAEHAESAGVDTLLDGEDADSAFGGNLAYLSDLLLQGRLRRWSREARLLSAHRWSRRGLLKFSATGLLPPVLDRKVSGAPTSAITDPILAAALVRETQLDQRLLNQEALRIWAPGRRYRAAQRRAGDPAIISTVAAEANAGALGKTVTMAHPFQDRRVLELAMALPWWACTRGGELKVVLRELAARRLQPGFLIQSKKANLGEYYEESVHGRERELVSQGLERAEFYADVIDSRTLGDLRNRFAEGRATWQAARVAVLALWMDKCGASDITEKSRHHTT